MDPSEDLEVSVDVDLVENIPDGALLVLPNLRGVLKQQLAVFDDQVE